MAAKSEVPNDWRFNQLLHYHYFRHEEQTEIARRDQTR